VEVGDGLIEGAGAESYGEVLAGGGSPGGRDGEAAVGEGVFFEIQGSDAGSGAGGKQIGRKQVEGVRNREFAGVGEEESGGGEEVEESVHGAAGTIGRVGEWAGGGEQVMEAGGSFEGEAAGGAGVKEAREFGGREEEFGSEAAGADFGEGRVLGDQVEVTIEMRVEGEFDEDFEFARGENAEDAQEVVGADGFRLDNIGEEVIAVMGAEVGEEESILRRGVGGKDAERPGRRWRWKSCGRKVRGVEWMSGGRGEGGEFVEAGDGEDEAAEDPALGGVAIGGVITDDVGEGEGGGGEESGVIDEGREEGGGEWRDSGGVGSCSRRRGVRLSRQRTILREA
jgi:hypothetical protein